MNWTYFSTAFVTLLIAEMGDKTQLAIMAQSASSRRPWSVWLGGSCALILVTGLGAWVGSAFSNRLPQLWIDRGAALLFVGMGVWMWFKK